MKFINTKNNYIEEIKYSALCTFLFGGFYFVYTGIWRHVVIIFFLDSILLTLSIRTDSFPPIFIIMVAHAFYIFKAKAFVRQHYLYNGWREIAEKPIKKEDIIKQEESGNISKCPVCNKPIHAEDSHCKFCGCNLNSYRNSQKVNPFGFKPK